jgi:hypothetical protein
MSFITNKQERIRFLKFSFVGVTGTVVDFGVMNLMSLVFHLPLVLGPGHFIYGCSYEQLPLESVLDLSRLEIEKST